MLISLGELCELNKAWSDDMVLFLIRQDHPESPDQMKIGSARRVFRLNTVIWFHGNTVMID